MSGEDDLSTVRRRSVAWAYVGAAILGATGTGLVVVATRWGPGLIDDSFAYAQAATDILAGAPPRLVPAFAPLLQVILASLAKLGVQPIPALRYLDGALFGVSVVLFGVAVYSATSSPLFLVLGSAAFLFSAPMIQIYAEALSEPLFITTICLGAVALGSYGRDGKWYWLAIAAICVGAAFATRYVGIAAVAAASVALLLRGGAAPRRKLIEVGTILLSAVGFMGWYLLLNALRTGALTNHGPFRIANVLSLPSRQNIYDMVTWFIPGRFVLGWEHVWGVLIVAGALVLGGLALWVRARPASFLSAGDRFRSLPFAFFAWYLGFSFIALFVSQGFVTLGDTFNQRYLLPTYLCALALAMMVVGMAWKLAQQSLRIPALVVTIVFGMVFIFRSANEVRTLYLEGSGYDSARWHVSETIAYLRLHPSVPLISTAAKGVSYWIGRPVAGFAADAETVQRQVCERGAWLVIIDSIPPEFYGVSTERVIQPLRLVERFSEGSIYSCALE